MRTSQAEEFRPARRKHTQLLLNSHTQKHKVSEVSRSETLFFILTRIRTSERVRRQTLQQVSEAEQRRTWT